MTNGTATQDYTITVTRETAAAAVVWSASLTVGTGSDVIGYDSGSDSGSLSTTTITLPGTDPAADGYREIILAGVTAIRTETTPCVS